MDAARLYSRMGREADGFDAAVSAIEAAWSVPVALDDSPDLAVFHRWVSVLSVGSFFIYLFHRPIWISVLAVFPQVSSGRESLVRMLVATPIVIAVSYGLQVAYTRILTRWRRGNGGAVG